MFERIWVTNRLLGGDFLCNAARVVSCKKVNKILVREADLDEAEYENLVKDILRIMAHNTDNFSIELILHSYFNVAKRLGIGNLHLPFDKFVNFNREAFSGTVGVSAHSLDEALTAQNLGVDYVVAGHIFDTPSHSGEAGRGLSFLKEIVENLKIPVYAIGGINDKNIHLIKSCGAKGAYMMRGVFG